MNVATCTTEEFTEYKNYWQAEVRNITIPPDVNTGIGQAILSDLDNCYAFLRIDLGELEAAKDKAESIIRQNERSKATGKNEDDRKKNATEFLEQYPVGDQTVDMYEWTRLINYRFTILKSLVETVNNKQQRLITMSGFMKIDRDLGNGMHN